MIMYMESSQEGRLGLKAIYKFKWKGRTFSQVSSIIKKNKRDSTLSTRMLFRPLPNKIYRREIATVTKPNTRNTSIVGTMETPGGTIVNSTIDMSTCKGNIGLVDFHFNETKTAKPCTSGCDLNFNENNPEFRNSKYIQSLSQQDNARRRVRSGGMNRPRFNSNGRSDNYTSSSQYLQSRNKTFKQNQYTNLRIGDSSISPGFSEDNNVYASNTVQYCGSNSTTGKTKYVPVYYKPNNSKFAQQGAVDAGSRLLRLKYDAITQGGNSMREAYGNHTANALAYGVPANGYTIKDKVGYPNKCTPKFPKGCFLPLSSEQVFINNLNASLNDPTFLQGANNNLDSGSLTSLSTSINISPANNIDYEITITMEGAQFSEQSSTSQTNLESYLNSFIANLFGVSTERINVILSDGSIKADIQVLSQGLLQKGNNIIGLQSGASTGSAVSMSSNGLVVAVGSSEYDSGNGGDSGCATIFYWNGSQWTQRGSNIDGTDSGDRFGGSISLSSNGNIVAIGAKFSPQISTKGYVGIYEWSGDSWVQKGNDIIGEANNDSSGTSVSLSSDGNIVAIGAPLNDNDGKTNSGHVRAYMWNSNTSSWDQLGSDIDGANTNDRSGSSVSLSADGHTVAIGETYNSGIDGQNTNGSHNQAGHVRVFDYNGTSWVQKGQNIEGETYEIYSGNSVSLSSNGNIVAIGSRKYDGGDVRVFHYNGTSWVQKGSNIDGKNTSSQIGTTVSLSSDGTIVAIGSSQNSEQGSKKGSVLLYKFNNNKVQWEQIGKTIYGANNNDENGTSVAISPDGTHVAMGAPGNNNDTGYARIYKIIP